MNVMVQCLLVDRNITERNQLSAMLESLGLDCHGLDRADEVLGFCNDNHPDLVVIDAGSGPENIMPGLAGQSHKPVVIVYSSTADFETMSQSILDGASDFLVKPFDRALLKFKLRQAGLVAG
jgi:two-component system, chemotaxis family, chemotaxis protein CheY